MIYDLVDPECNLIFGAVVDPAAQAGGEVSITLIATGFGAGALAGSAVAPFVGEAGLPAERRGSRAAPLAARLDPE